MVAHSTVQSCTRPATIHNAILFIETSTMLDATKLILLLGSHIWRYLLVITFMICDRFCFQVFPHENDTCYLAHCYPYTYTDLKDNLEHLLSDSERSKVMHQDILCETRAKNSCFLVTVTNFGNIFTSHILPKIYECHCTLQLLRAR